MDMFGEARSIRSMMDLGNMTQSKLSLVLGVSQPYIANKLRLLNFSDRVQKRILDYGLSERHARCILRLKDEEDQMRAIDMVHEGRMNVARCEILVDTMLDEKLRLTPRGTNFADRIGHFEDSLESSLSLLREIGIRARAQREEVGERIYFSICIG